jgi:hypothetical protein
VAHKNTLDLQLMRPETQARLDAHSKQPGRKHTYWKRYYELLTRTDLYFDRIVDRKTARLPLPETSGTEGTSGATGSADVRRFYVAVETVDVLNFDGVETFYIFGLSAAPAILQVDLAVARAAARKISVTTIEHRHADKMIDSRWKHYALDFDEDMARWRTIEGFEHVSVTLNSASKREFEIQVNALGEPFDEDEEEEEAEEKTAGKTKQQLVSTSFYQ